MCIEDIVLEIFCLVDDWTGELPKHTQAKLYPSELITIAILKAIKGQSTRRFYNWLKNTGWFPTLPDYTRLFRLLRQATPLLDVLSRDDSDAQNWLVIDSTGCEVVHPRREGRALHWIAKTKHNGRWIVGMKVVILADPTGHILDWQLDTANVHDKHFAWMIEEVTNKVLSDQGFHNKEGDPDNLIVCQRGQHNERMVVESIFSLCKRLLGLNTIQAKTRQGFETALTQLFATFNTLLALNKKLGITSKHPAIAHFCIF